MERGQTIIDFGIGASVFLLSLLLVLTFSSSLFVPFQGSQSDVIQKTRVAEALSNDVLTDSTDGEAYILDEECTAYIFAESNSSQTNVQFPNTDCSFDDGDTFTSEIPVQSTEERITNLRLTIEDDSGTPIKLDSVNNENEVIAAYGDVPPEDRNTVDVARRDVYVDGEVYRLYVRIWV